MPIGKRRFKFLETRRNNGLEWYYITETVHRIKESCKVGTFTVTPYLYRHWSSNLERGVVGIKGAVK